MSALPPTPFSANAHCTLCGTSIDGVPPYFGMPLFLCSEACEACWVASKVLAGYQVTELSRTMVGVTDRDHRQLVHRAWLMAWNYSENPLAAQMLLDKTITAELLA